MRWTNLVTLSQTLWLGVGHAASVLSLPAADLAPRQNPPGAAADGFVYRGDRRSPREIRGTGGMRPQGDGWEAHDSSFDLNRHYTSGPNGCGLDDADEPGFVFRTAYVSAAQGRATAERYGDWLYEVRATPNILDNGDNEGEVMALGGVHWRQIRRYTRMRNAEDNRVDEAQWIENPEYDAETYERGPHAAQCRVSTTFPRVLAGEAPSSSDSDSDSDSEGSDEGVGAGPSRRLFNAADIFMDRTPGVYELYGDFPPRWQTFPARDDIPGPDHPTPPVAEDDQAGQQLQHYIDMGVQELNRLFPGGDEILQELFRDIRPIGCPSLTGFGSHFGRSEALADRRARRATAGKHGCCKMLSSFRKKTQSGKAKGSGGVVEVDICQNGPLNPPCTVVKAPGGKCVAMPKDYKDNVSGVKTHEASSICRFYLTPDCKGEYFEAGNHAVDLHAPRPKFNDKVASIRCDTFHKPAAPARWEWSAATSQPQWCERLDSLHLDFALANNHGSGTYDKIKLAFDGAGQKPHVIVEGPSPGDKISQEINMLEIFGMDTVAVDQIKRVRLLDELTDWTFGGDAWELAGFKLKGRCAGSGIPVVLEKFAALNAGLQAKPTDVGRFMYHRDWEVWAADVAPAEWTARPMCSHFRGLGLTLAIEDADWAGTDNSLYAKVGPTGRFLIARSPSRREVFTVDMSVRKAFGVDAVPVGQVDVVGIASEGGHDAVKPKEVTIYGHCSGASHQALSVKQTITNWIYDAETLKINIAPDMWVKV